MNPVTGVADKCTFCDHRETPACVEVCPADCIGFGDLDDNNSEVARLVKGRKSTTLKPEAGTNPSIFYLT
jgi:Fe-S-cluster-containing dehydrogenase component